jgi:hypothetical protein
MTKKKMMTLTLQCWTGDCDWNCPRRAGAVGTDGCCDLILRLEQDVFAIWSVVGATMTRRGDGDGATMTLRGGDRRLESAFVTTYRLRRPKSGSGIASAGEKTPHFCDQRIAPCGCHRTMQAVSSIWNVGATFDRHRFWSWTSIVVSNRRPLDSISSAWFGAWAFASRKRVLAPLFPWHLLQLWTSRDRLRPNCGESLVVNLLTGFPHFVVGKSMFSAMTALYASLSVKSFTSA